MKNIWISWLIFLTTNRCSDHLLGNFKHDSFERGGEDPIPTAPRLRVHGNQIKVQLAMKEKAQLPEQGRNQLCGLMMLRRMMHNNDTEMADIWCCKRYTLLLPRDLMNGIVETMTREIQWTAYPLRDVLRVLDARLGRTEDPIWVAVCNLHSMIYFGCFHK